MDTYNFFKLKIKLCLSKRNVILTCTFSENFRHLMKNTRIAQSCFIHLLQSCKMVKIAE